jgi:acyl-CoA synthetase (AMP-forming)/AMP-acid ligase II
MCTTGMLLCHKVEVSTGLAVTYDAFTARAEMVARRLMGHGCRPRDVVAILAPNSIDWLAVMAAVFRIGAVPAGINALLTLGGSGIAN